jgi:CheY-like chemotaxis protein
VNSNAKAGLVLVLEDDRLVAEVLAMLIEEWGYGCVHGASFDELLPTIQARGGEIRAIVSDYHLQDGATGLEAMARVAAAGVTAPVLLLTSAVQGQVRRAAAAAGYRFMEKPVRPARLKAWLDQVTAGEAPLG